MDADGIRASAERASPQREVWKPPRKSLKFVFQLATSGVIAQRCEDFSTVLKSIIFLKVGAKIPRGAKINWAHDASCVIASPRHRQQAPGRN